MEKIKKARKNIVIIFIAVYVISLLFSGWRNFRRGIYIGDSFFTR